MSPTTVLIPDIPAQLAAASFLRLRKKTRKDGAATFHQG